MYIFYAFLRYRLLSSFREKRSYTLSFQSSFLRFLNFKVFLNFFFHFHIHFLPKWYDYGNVLKEERWNEKFCIVLYTVRNSRGKREVDCVIHLVTPSRLATPEKTMTTVAAHSHITKQKTNRPKRFDFEIEWSGIDWMLAIRATKTTAATKTTCTNIGKVINERKEVLEIYSLIYQRAVVCLSVLCSTSFVFSLYKEHVLNFIFWKLFSINHSYHIWMVVGKTIA